MEKHPGFFFMKKTNVQRVRDNGSSGAWLASSLLPREGSHSFLWIKAINSSFIESSFEQTKRTNDRV
jgi:hypothetical protein